MKNKQFFILILLLVIGFASISATLIINGNTKVAANIDDFNVIFIEGFLNGETNENIVISGDKKTLTFTTNILTNINDIARIDYKVKNISTQYDGDVTINCTNEANEYVNVTSSFDGQNLPLTNSINMQAQEVKSGYINAELTKATTEEQEIKITCKIEVNATSRTNYAYSLSFDSNGGTNVEDKIVEYNSNYGKLSTPTKEGYEFIGWFNEEDVMVDETTILDTKGNKTLTAKWAELVYPVTILKNYPETTESIEINVPYGEKVDALITIDDKYFINNIKCENGYTVENYNKDELVYGNRTITIKNNRITESGSCTVSLLQGVFPYAYTGTGGSRFNSPFDGNYKFETWGAGTETAGGAYTSGTMTIEKGKTLFVYVGGQQINSTANVVFNSGTKNVYYSNDYKAFRAQSSSGSTDIRISEGNWNDPGSLRSRIMVAAGAGSNCGNNCGGPGGGLLGYDGKTNESTGTAGKGASQTAGGQSGNASNGSFGIGAQSVPGGSTDWAGSGGGGWYGGGAGFAYDLYSCGGSGSSYISGHTGCVAITSLSSSTPKSGCSSGTTNNSCSVSPTNYKFTDTIMIDGAGYKWTNVKGEQTGMPTHDGKSTMTGNEGYGYAKITYLGK